MISKAFNSVDDALSGLKDNMTIMFGGFGLSGIPENSIAAIRKKGTKNSPPYSVPVLYKPLNLFGCSMCRKKVVKYKYCMNKMFLTPSFYFSI